MLLRKWPYLGTGAEKQKSKTTFFSRMFKVEEGKVTLLFGFLPPSPRYGYFVICPMDMLLRNWQYLGKGAENQKK